MRDAASSDILAVWKRAAPRNRMREIFTSGSVGGLAEQSLALPGHTFAMTFGQLKGTEPWPHTGVRNGSGHGP